MNQINSVQQIIQSLLQPDEQLLWWERPRLKKMRSPLKPIDVLSTLLFDGVISVVLVLTINVKGNLDLVNAIEAFIIFYICFALVGYLRLYCRTFTAALKKSPPYRKFTLYAITDCRAMIIVHLPGTKSSVLEYLPHEIGVPTSIVRPDGAGTLTFAVPRQAKVSSYESSRTFPGSFFGISNVQEVTALLEQLRSKSELHS